MHTNWQNYLLQAGAVVENGCVTRFGELRDNLTAAADGSVVADLSGFGMLHFSGEDAASFLHGQLSCDVKKLAPNTCTFGGYCSPKGRMLANFLLWRNDAGYYMALSRSLVTAIQKRLTMFVLRAKVKVADMSDTLVMLGIAGPAGTQALSALYAQLPERDHNGVADESGLLLRLSASRWMWIADAAAAQRHWPTLAAKLTPAGSAAWEWLDIQAGVPWITAATLEQFVPQMTNLELIGGVSFQKGCYPGQEIVARTQYLGKLKRRMFLASVDAGAAPAPGVELFSDDLGEQASGMVVNAQLSPSGDYDLLAVAQVGSVQGSTVRLGSPQGPALRFHALPYTVT